jgi:hypothetical protein
MASPVPAAAIGKFGGLTPGGLLQEILGNLAVAGGGALLGAATESMVPQAPQGSSGSKYMITLQDVKEIQKYVDNENYRRSLLNMMPGGQDLPMLNAEEIIATREAELRRSADEAGAREYAIESLSVPRAVIPAMANQIAPSAQATSQAAQQFLQSYLQRPNIDPSLAEVARGM